MDETRGLWRGKTLPKSNAEAFNNVWVEGDLIHFGEHYYIHPLANAVKVQNELGRLVVMHEVDPSTLGECTGFPDKNDNIAFEGDIIKFTYGSETVIEVVKYDKYIAAFILNDGVHSYLFGGDVFSGNCEIIGNIHDNPELLKGENSVP